VLLLQYTNTEHRNLTFILLFFNYKIFTIYIITSYIVLYFCHALDNIINVERIMILFFLEASWKNKTIIDSLGRWFDDSRMADRNHRFPANESREFCSNRVVNITPPTFILSAEFGSYCSQTLKYLIVGFSCD